MCKIEAQHLSAGRARMLVCCGACSTWLIIMLIHWAVLYVLKPTYTHVDSGPLMSNTNNQWSSQTRDLPELPPAPRPTMPPIWTSLEAEAAHVKLVEPFWATRKPTTAKDDFSGVLTIRFPSAAPTVPRRPSKSPSVIPSRSPVTRAPTWRPTTDHPHGEFLVLARNGIMRNLRDFIGLVHYQSPDRVIYVVTTPHLADMYHAELANMMPIVLLRVTTQQASFFGDKDEQVGEQSFHSATTDTLDMMSMLFVASDAFPGLCFLAIDLTCMSLWGHNSVSEFDNGMGRWPGEFHVPSPIECDVPKLVNECASEHAPMLLMPARVSWEMVHAATRDWMSSKNAHACSELRRRYYVTTDDEHIKILGDSCAKSISTLLDRYFETQPSTLQITSPISIPSSRHPKCNIHHVMRSAEVHHFEDNSKLNICYAIPTRGKPTGDWAMHPLIVNTLATMSLTMNNTSPRFNRRIYVGWEDSDLVINAFQGIKELMREMRKAVHHVDIDIILVEFPPCDQDIVYIWNSLFAKGFDDGCDYLMHITDDVDFVNSPGVGMGWEDKFVDALLSHGNIGLVSGFTELNTQPFVHRTHIEIFGTFYPYQVHNIWCDTVVWAMYKSLGMLRGPAEMKHWINFSDGPGRRRYAECDLRQEWKPVSGVETWRPEIGEFKADLVKKYLLETRSLWGKNVTNGTEYLVK